jgi:hypothetical protein
LLPREDEINLSSRCLPKYQQILCRLVIPDPSNGPVLPVELTAVTTYFIIQD